MKHFLWLLPFLFLSCNSKIERQFNDIKNEIDFATTISNCDQIVFKKAADTIIKKAKSLSFSTTKKSSIDEFEHLFDNLQITDYCCCPNYEYTITFLDGTKNIDEFGVDVTTSVAKVQIFDNSYQYSYIIEKQKWDDFLKKIK